MRHILALAIVASFSTPAFAQWGANPNPSVKREEEDRKRQAADVEKRYNEMMKKSRQQEQPAKKPDPWGNVR
jgi:hypothetical protein